MTRGSRHDRFRLVGLAVLVVVVMATGVRAGDVTAGYMLNMYSDVQGVNVYTHYVDDLEVFTLADFRAKSRAYGLLETFSIVLTHRVFTRRTGIYMSAVPGFWRFDLPVVKLRFADIDLVVKTKVHVRINIGLTERGPFDFDQVFSTINVFKLIFCGRGVAHKEKGY